MGGAHFVVRMSVSDIRDNSNTAPDIAALIRATRYATGEKNEPLLEQPDARSETLCAGRTAAHRGTGQAQHQRKPLWSVAARARSRQRRSGGYAASLSGPAGVSIA